MTDASGQRWLTRYAVATAAATLVLICFGGLVTSHGAGLAVPDWPNSYGYNMFLFPVSSWVGGIFYEHTHRLVASGVGLMTVILAIWLQAAESRRWLRGLGWLALGLVVLQGVLGGLRVTLLKDWLGLVHGALAQSFLCLVSAIALFRTRFWQRLEATPVANSGRLRGLLIMAVSLIFLQLLLGAAMRHRHAGLAVPDFPLAYGRWWPATDAASLARYNGLRMETRAVDDITAGDVLLHMAHRLNALLVLGAVLVAGRVTRRCPPRSGLRPGGRLWVGLTIGQAGLGVWTVLSNKAADVATAHVAVGSSVLATGVLLLLLSFRALAPAPSGPAEGAPGAGGV